LKFVGEISQVETIAAGLGIREVARLRKVYGRWAQAQGYRSVRLDDGSFHLAEVHWYEAAGIGRKEFKSRKCSERHDG
jgi:hypothetical protein